MFTNYKVRHLAILLLVLDNKSFYLILRSWRTRQFINIYLKIVNMKITKN